MGVYGSMLAFFPELVQSFEYFEMPPKVTFGYSHRIDLGKVRGIFQYMKKGELLRQNDVLDDVSIPTFWSRSKLKNGNFITVEDVYYRITNPSAWQHEGSFTIYVLETVTGNTDRQEKHDYVNLGQNDYD